MLRFKLLVGFCFVVTVFVCFVTIKLEKSNPVTSLRLHEVIRVTELENVNNASNIVLLWTPFFGEQNYVSSVQQKVCIHRDCVFTSNKTLLEKSKIIVFHLFDTTLSDMPKYRRNDQIWMLFVLESPVHTGSLDMYNGLFNWTATYRIDSDIWTPYAHVMKLNNSISTVNDKNYVIGKGKLISWFTSNCNTVGGRELFVNELKKYVNVDVYGACGNLECHPKMSFDCYKRVAKEYYFYLSFENSICKDYATEKFFHILKFDLVPVVFGGANYSAIAPPGSYIDALSFQSPRALADYLTMVSRNSTLYNSYFAWRDTHSLGGYHWMCEVCRRMKAVDGEEMLPASGHVYSDLNTWWIMNSKCMKWTSEGLKPS